jgi:hypothetical protein
MFNNHYNLFNRNIFSEQHLEDTLKKRNAEFHILEEKLRQFEEKVNQFIFFSFYMKNK